MRTQASRLVPIVLLLAVFIFSACGPAKTHPMSDAKHYHLQGRVVSIDKANQSATIAGENIPGFMAAMTMPYKIKDSEELKQLAAGDSITAEIVAGPSDYWLENVRVTHPRDP